MLEWPSAVGLGALVAFLFSLKQVNPEVRIELNVWSFLVFGIGTAGAWFLTRAVFRVAEEAEGEEETAAGQSPAKAAAARWSRVTRMAYLVAVLAGITAAAFYFALRDVTPAKRWDVMVGTGAAFLFVGGAMFFFWRLVRFLESQGQPLEEEEEDHGGDDEEENGDDPLH
jgi:hypothetical protein